MTVLDLLANDSKNIPKTFGYRINNNLLTIDDQEKALTKPYWAYAFALYVPGADIKKCEEAACKNPEFAYLFARDVPGADIKKCEEAACKDPEWAYYFALHIPGADKEKCMKAAGK